jgi:hypothetical protein
MPFSRRTFVKILGSVGVAGFGLWSYAFAAESRIRPVVTHYRLGLPRWPQNGRRLRIAALADIHVCEPWMPLSRVEEIVSRTNRLEPDVIVLLGDYVTGLKRFRSAVIPPEDWGRALGRLSAPLGTYAVLGNHDWWEDIDGVRAAFAANRIPVLENSAALLAPTGGAPLWLAGLGDQLAHFGGRNGFTGVDDLPATLAGIPEDGRPIVLLAHEPDIFPEVPARVGLTLAGHTHGGQVALPYFGRPIVPSAYGARYAYGHIVEDGRHLIVSGGLGCSGLPVRLGVPPEIVVVDLGELSDGDAVAI